MTTPQIIATVMALSGIGFGVLGSYLAFYLDKENKKPHLAPIRYFVGAWLIGMAIMAFIFAGEFFKL